MVFSVWLNVNKIERSWFQDGIVVRLTRRDVGWECFKIQGLWKCVKCAGCVKKRDETLNHLQRHIEYVCAFMRIMRACMRAHINLSFARDPVFICTPQLYFVAGYFNGKSWKIQAVKEKRDAGDDGRGERKRKVDDEQGRSNKWGEAIRELHCSAASSTRTHSA